MWGARPSSTMHLAGSGNALFLFPSGVAFLNGPQRQTLHQPMIPGLIWGGPIWEVPGLP